jgi:hypothetical protein
VPASRFLIPATNDFSVFLWTRDDAASPATVQYLSDNSGPTQTNRCSFGSTFSATTSPGKLFFFHPDATFTGNTSVRDSGWHHVGLVRRGTVMELWLDGELDGSRDYGEGFTLSQATDWRVGGVRCRERELLDRPAGRLAHLPNALAAADISALYDS